MKLMLVDTTGIQPYIFGSNVLRENIGASHVVDQATGSWVAAALPHSINLKNLAAQVPIEQGAAAELIYAGGGNALIIFQTPAGRDTFLQKYSERLLCCAPNLQVATASIDLTWRDGQNDLHDAVKTLFETKIAHAKQFRHRSEPLMGLGVTVAGQSTGFPAIAMSKPIEGEEETSGPISAEVVAKRSHLGGANDRLDEELQIPQPADHPRYSYPYDFDNIGRTEDEHSYIAVVHADGDGIGERTGKIGADAADNRTYINARRMYSQQLQAAAREAMIATLSTLMQHIELDSNGQPEIPHFNKFGDELAVVFLKKSKAGKGYDLPFRPIVFGGDDITFVCDGRLALALTRIYADAFKQSTRTHLAEFGGEASVSAGIAIVKSHYPFARAYQLADDLASSAKRYRHYLAHIECADGNQWSGGCIDWHFAMSGLLGDLDELRRRQYCVPDGMLTVRPVTLDDNPGTRYRSWPTIRRLTDVFQDADMLRDGDQPEWSIKKNKLKALHEALREGPRSVEKFLTAHRGVKQLPAVGVEGSQFESTGWMSERTPYFDAIELVDWFIPLDKVQSQGGEQ